MARSILIVTNRAPWPLQDGGALAMHQIITGYKAQGWTVHLFTMNTHRHWVEEGELRAAYASLDSITVIPFDNRVRPVRLARNYLLSREPEHAERFYDKRFELALVQAVQRVQPDVVQVESIFLTGYLPAIRAASRAALVLRMHNVEYQVWDRAASDARGSRRFYLRSLARRMKRFEHWAWSQYHLLLPITPDDEKAVRNAGCSTSMHLTPFGISITAAADLPKQQPPDAPRKFYHLGAMDWIPNREGVAWFVREVWPHIQAQNISYEFHFGGRALEKDFAAPLPAGVTNHGPVEDAAAFTAGMDTLVVPLRAGGGIRVKILEAMAAGKLVISTTVGIQGIAATQGIHFLQADTPEEFSEAVGWLSGSPDRSVKMVAAARALVAASYDAKNIAAGLSERLHRVLQERR